MKIVLLFYVICFGIAIYISMTCPFSLLFDYFHDDNELVAIVTDLNEQRTHRADEYFKRRARDVASRLIPVQLDILVVIVTVARSAGGHYLTQTAAAMDREMRGARESWSLALLVCNVDKTPEYNVEASRLKRHFMYADKSRRLDGRSVHIPRLVNSGLKDPARIQEISDYVLCLNTSLVLNYSYILVVEDDVIPVHDVFDVMQHALKQKLSHVDTLRSPSSHMTTKIPFSFLKLYYPQRWQGYAFEKDRIIELVSFGLFFGGLTFALFSCNMLVNSRTVYASYFRLATHVIMFVVLAKLLGRVSVNELRRVSPHVYRFGASADCCTQAMLYPRAVLPGIMSHLLVNNSRNKDLAIAEFARTARLPGYQLEPNLFHHIGMRTSLAGGRDKRSEEFLIRVPDDTFS